MPILIDELEIELEPGPFGAGPSQADLMPLAPPEQDLARLLALMDERRERLKVD